jgi:hypothetical protein
MTHSRFDFPRPNGDIYRVTRIEIVFREGDPYALAVYDPNRHRAGGIEERIPQSGIKN